MKKFDQLKEKLSNEITPIVAFGLIAIVAIILFTGLSRLADATQSVKSQLDSSKQELVSLLQLPEDGLWDQRLAQSEAAQNKITAQLWQGGTAGVISADLEQHIRVLAEKSQIVSPSIRVDPLPVTINDIELLRFEVRANIPDAVAAITFLSNLENASRKIFFSNSNLAMSESRQSILSFDGHIPIQIPTENGP